MGRATCGFAAHSVPCEYGLMMAGVAHQPKQIITIAAVSFLPCGNSQYEGLVKLSGAQRRHQHLVFACFYLSSHARIPLWNIGKPARSRLVLSGPIQ